MVEAISKCLCFVPSAIVVNSNNLYLDYFELSFYTVSRTSIADIESNIKFKSENLCYKPYAVSI